MASSGTEAGAPAQSAGLRFELKDELPAQLAVGRGAARLIRGWCFHPERRIESLALTVDGEEHPVLVHSLPRGDVLARMYPDSDPEGHSYRSGFYGLVTLLADNGSARSVELGLSARLRGGAESRARVAALELLPSLERARAAAPVAGDPAIAIAMATYDPDPELFERQLDSIRRQSESDWICVISDDLSRPDLFARIERIVGDDPRFVVSRSERRSGFFRNFERALELVPPGVEFVAYADQDDIWHPEKLAALRAELEGGAQLAYSDLRVVRPDGALVSDTYWTSRPNSAERVDELLVANTVTGAASMFRRELLEDALPFPQALPTSFHDQWIAAVALCAGEVRYLDRPLHDYVQHDDNVLGHMESRFGFGFAGRIQRWRRQRPEGVGRRRRASLALRRWQTIYFEGVCRMQVDARTLLARFGDRLSARRRRELERLAELDSGRGMRWLVARRLRRPARRSPTIGVETSLAKALLWRRLLSARSRLRRRPAPASALAGAAPDDSLVHRVSVIEMIETKIEPLNLELDSSATPRVNVLIPYVDLGHFFGGYIGMFNLARRLAERGSAVRILSVEPPPQPLPADWRERVSGYEGLDRITGLVEFESVADRGRPLTVSPRDGFVSMSCWTAYVAGAATKEIGRERFVSLVQEYEPFFHPMGSLAALTRGAYELPHIALFSTEILRDYFRANGIGVYSDGVEAGDRLSLSFENALTTIEPPSREQMAAAPPRLLFYARPEQHAARNMYELGHLALARLIEDGTLGEEWELYGIGARESGSIDLARGRALRLLARQSQDEYAEVLRSCSVGLSLMLTPHPSLVPLEMAAAGMRVVTNEFENKTAERLTAISTNLIAAEPTIAGVESALRDAIATAGDYDARLAGTPVNWASDWEQALGDSLLERLEALLADA